MPATVYADVDGRTNLTLGVELFDYTNGQRGFHVAAAGSGRTSLIAGLEAARDAGDPWHPDFDDNHLPLAYVTGSMWGTTDVYGVQVYRRSRFTPPRYAAFDYALEHRFNVGNRTIYTIHNEQYQTSLVPGYTFGDSYGTTTVEYTRNVITVETPLSQHPRPAIELATGRSIGQLKGTMNQYAMTVNTVLRPAGTLRFDSLTVQPFDTPEGQGYWCTYTFIEDESGWWPTFLFNVLAPCDSITPTPDTPNLASTCQTADSYGLLYTLVECMTYPVTYVAGGQIFVRVPYEPIDYRRCFPTHDGGSDSGGSGDGGGNNQIPGIWPYAPYSG